VKIRRCDDFCSWLLGQAIASDYKRYNDKYRLYNTRFFNIGSCERVRLVDENFTNMKSMERIVLPLLCFAYAMSYGQPNPNQRVAGLPVNYDETKVGTYALPDPLTLENGQKVSSKEVWISQRRPELHRLFETTQFGKTPPKPADLSFNVFDPGTLVFGGKAIRKQVTIYFTKDT